MIAEIRPEQLAADRDLDGLLTAGQSVGERATRALGSQAAQLWLKARLDVVKVPAKPLDLCGALADEVLAVIEQELF